MKTLILALAAFGLSASAFAGDAAYLKNLGFSDDGKYYAFVEYGTQDGSGFPYADVSVVTVATNKLARVHGVVVQNENATEKQALDKALAESRLADFGLVAGKNSGRTVVLHSRDEAGVFTDVQFSVSEWQSPVYELTLAKKLLPDHTNGQWCTQEGGPAGFTLSLKSVSGTDQPLNLTLQDDQELPKSRGCALTNSIAQVIVNGKALVVLVKYGSVGFEGPDYRYLAVTGTPALQ
jgi:predicted secreted protein